MFLFMQETERGIKEKMQSRKLVWFQKNDAYAYFLLLSFINKWKGKSSYH